MTDSIDTSEREAEEPREPIRLPVREMRDEPVPHQPADQLRAALQLALEATPEQLPAALDELRAALANQRAEAASSSQQSATDIRFQLLAAANYVDALGGDSRSYRQALASSPAQPQQGEQPIDALALYRELCDLVAEAGAVDTVIGRPEVLRARLAKLRDAVGATTRDIPALGAHPPAPPAQSEDDLAALDREHMSDFDKRIGIYAAQSEVVMLTDEQASLIGDRARDKCGGDRRAEAIYIAREVERAHGIGTEKPTQPEGGA